MKTKKIVFLVMTLSLGQLAYGQALPADPPPVPDPTALPAFLFDPAPLPAPAVTNPPPADPPTNTVTAPVVTPAVVGTNPPPIATSPTPVVTAAVSNAPPTTTGVAMSSLTQADLETLAKLLQASLTKQVQPAPVAPRPTPTTSLERFARVPETNRIIVDARWKTSLGDGEYLETRIIEAGTTGAQQAVPEVPSVAELVSALTTARVAQQASATQPAKVAARVPVVPQAQSQVAQVAQNEPEHPQVAASQSVGSPATPKNPVILQDGKLADLPGQWLFTKDGTPVFVPKAPPQQPVVAATEPDDQDEERPFTLLVPAGGNAPAPQYEEDVSKATYRGGRAGTYGNGAGSRSSGRRSQIGINGAGFPVLLGSGYNRGDIGRNSQGFPVLLGSGQY